MVCTGLLENKRHAVEPCVKCWSRRVTLLPYNLDRQKVGRTAALDHKVTLWKWLAPPIWKPATFPLHVVLFKTLGNKAKTKPPCNYTSDLLIFPLGDHFSAFDLSHKNIKWLHQAAMIYAQ